MANGYTMMDPDQVFGFGNSGYPSAVRSPYYASQPGASGFLGGLSSFAQQTMPIAGLLGLGLTGVSSFLGGRSEKKRAKELRRLAEQRYRRAMEYISQVGKVGRTRIERGAAQQTGRATSALARRGLASSTVREAARRGIASDTEFARQGLEDELARLRLSAEGGFGGDVLSAVESPTYRYPTASDVGQYALGFGQLLANQNRPVYQLPGMGATAGYPSAFIGS